MQIYISRNGQQSGPFSLDQLIAMSAHGSVLATDLAWSEGAVGWTPLGEFLRAKSGALGSATPPPVPSSSPLGLAGFIISAAGIPIWISILVLAVLGHNRNSDSHSPFMMLVGLALFAMLGINVLGIMLGFIAVSKKHQRKPLTIVGLALNLLQFAVIILLTLVGLSMK